MARKALIHFHSADDRFCGSTQQCRRFSLDPNDVTCPACQGKDTLTLSTEGAAFLASLGGEPAPTETTHGLRPRDDHAWMLPAGEG
jgi:hypothetical protein